MRKLLFALSALAALTLLAPAPGSAEEGHVGIFFDDGNGGFVHQIDAAAFGVVPTHVVVYAHDFAALYGYEFGYTIDGNIMVSATALMGAGPIDVGGAPGNHIVGLASPLVTTPETIICTLSIFLLDDQPVLFTVHGATPNSVPGSNTPVVLLDNDRIVRCGVSAWDMDLEVPVVCASINSVPEIVATDEASWDQVKSLYR